MACGFIPAKIPPAQRPAPAAGGPGGAVPGRMMLPPLCRPAGWACAWRRMGNVSVLDCGAEG
jgi:hypothetical protein